MPKTVEVFPPYAAFWSNCKGYPTSVMLDILTKMLHVEVAANEEGNEQEYLTLLESAKIMGGDNKMLNRAMLANGDAFWGRQYRLSVGRMEGPQRLEYLRKILQLSFALGLTRAGGSDTYENIRVASYGKFMMEHPNESAGECRRAYTMLMEEVLRGRRLSCGGCEAIQLYAHVMFECNRLRWRFRPDNLFLFAQMLVSDMMLAFNFYESCIGGASNGIGATLIVRDGGGNYRRFMPREVANEGQATPMYSVYDKSNGTGADTVINAIKEMTNVRGYWEESDVGSEWFSEVRLCFFGLCKNCYYMVADVLLGGAGEEDE